LKQNLHSACEKHKIGEKHGTLPFSKEKKTISKALLKIFIYLKSICGLHV
jgi:hypothetical protein